MPEQQPPFNWDTTTRATGMLRYSPVIGLDFLKLVEQQADINAQETVVSKAAQTLVTEYTPRYLNDKRLDVSHRLGALECFALNQTIQSADSAMSPLAEIRLSDHIKSWAKDRGEMLYFGHEKTLEIAYANMFTVTNYALMLLAKEGVMPGILNDPEATVGVIRMPWFSELLYDMARASQGFWSIPEPRGNWRDIGGAGSRVRESIAGVLHSHINSALAPEGKFFTTNESGGVALSPLVKAAIDKSRKYALHGGEMRSRKELEVTYGESISWQQRTSSGCPVAHRKIGAKAIEETFTPDQIELFERKGIIIKRPDQGYDLHDFMGFTANFVADYLEALNTKIDSLQQEN